MVDTRDNLAAKNKRTKKAKPSIAELIQLFWSSPPEAYFNQLTVAPVTGCSPKTLECDRWKRNGIPFRKVGGRVLYKKIDVIRWLESHALVESTSQYTQEVAHAS